MLTELEGSVVACPAGDHVADHTAVVAKVGLRDVGNGEVQAVDSTDALRGVVQLHAVEQPLVGEHKPAGLHAEHHVVPQQDKLVTRGHENEGGILCTTREEQTDHYGAYNSQYSLVGPI